MVSAEPSQSSGIVARTLAVVRRRPLEITTGILLSALAVQAYVKRESEWNYVFVGAGQRLLAGEDIYGDGQPYAYPPFLALVASPFSFLPPLASRACWFVASAVAMIVMLRAAWSVAGGPPTAGYRNWERRELIAAGLGLACAMTYILNAFAHQQVDVIIGALMMVGCLRLLARQESSGADWIGVAAACKATPLLWSPYLLLRRRLLAGMLVVIVAVGVNLVPDLIASPPGGGVWLERWVTRIVLPTQQPETALGTWGSALIFNQSLGGTTQRLVNTTLKAQGGELAVVTRPLVEPPTLKLIYFLLLAFMIAISVAVAARAPPASEGSMPPVVFEFGIVVTLMLLVSPMSSKAHFGVLILPAFCLARFAVHNRDRTILALVAAAAALAVACNRDLVGYIAYTSMLWIGTVTLCTLLLWLGCVLALARRRNCART